jgi:signal transduction histidine kinase
MTRRPGRLARWRVAEWFTAAVGLLVVVSIVGLVAGLLALSRLADRRMLLVDRLDPAITSTLRLSAAMLNEETGVRGFALARQEVFLEPYVRGRRDEAAALRELEQRLGPTSLGLGADVADVRGAATAWRTQFAEPVIADVRTGRADAYNPRVQADGERRFDEVRRALGRLQGALQVERADARTDLESAATTVRVIFVAFGVAVLLTVLATAVLLRNVVVAPLGRLADRVRAVAGGDFGRRVEADGAREVVRLGEDVEGMRRRIVAELDALSETRDDLARSNAELEQFAYVASHDLQEPLRKVASFTQMLQRRYEGQLDERADQYIGFAVDGAKRMQALINDLLAFSRVGRIAEPQVVVDCNALAASARAGLASRIEETGATVEIGELPHVRGEASLLQLVFQNLLGNGLKFRGDEPPHVRMSAERSADGSEWRFTVADNGIGIAPEYADRIFIIFQRLHPRTEYEGTGIGLAMCRKVIEYHGGRIWLDTDGGSGGATFHFTLPAIPDGTQTATEPETDQETPS